MITMMPTKRYVLTSHKLHACLVFLSLAWGTATVCGAQSGPNRFYGQPSPLTGKILVIPPGTTLEGRIESTIGSKKSRQGERFSMTIFSPVLANGSDVIIPVGAEMLGDVVEAIPASKVPHDKRTAKPIGKLRVQISSLKMPDGTTYPLVASIVGEKPTRNSRYGNNQGPDLGGGIAYVGNENNFDAVAPRSQPSRGRPKVLTKSELMRDPIYGKNDSGNGNNHYDIRSLVRKKRDLFIYKGSPISVRLNAALKIGMAASEGAASILEAPAKVTGDTNIDNSSSTPHRFIRPTPPAPPPVNAVIDKPLEASPASPPAIQPNVLPGILPDNPSLVLPAPGAQKVAPAPPPNNPQVSPF
jgi:hypothetical protein